MAIGTLKRIGPHSLNKGLCNKRQDKISISLFFIFLIVVMVYLLLAVTAYKITTLVRQFISRNTYNQMFDMEVYKEMFNYNLLTSNFNLFKKIINASFAVMKKRNVEEGAVIFVQNFVEKVHMLYGFAKRFDAYLLHEKYKGTTLKFEDVSDIHIRISITHDLCQNAIKFMLKSLKQSIINSVINKKIYSYLNGVNQLIQCYETQLQDKELKGAGWLALPSKLDQGFVPCDNMPEMALNLDDLGNKNSFFYNLLCEMFGFTRDKTDKKSPDIVAELQSFVGLVRVKHGKSIKTKGNVETHFWLYNMLKIIRLFFSDAINDLGSAKELTNLAVMEDLEDELNDIESVYSVSVQATNNKLIKYKDATAINAKLAHINGHRNMFLCPLVLNTETYGHLFRDVDRFVGMFTQNDDMRSRLKNFLYELYLIMLYV